MEIFENLTKINFTSANNLNRILYLVIHYTGNNGDTAYNNTVYFKTVSRGASAHYFVDENEIWVCVPDKHISWHCGTTGTYYHDKCRNSNSIGIELCSRKDSNGNYYFKEQTVINALWLCNMLMEKYGIPINNILRHYDITHKICPEPYVRNTALWNDFKNNLGVEDMTEQETTNKINTAISAFADTLPSIIEKTVDDYFEKRNNLKPSNWAETNWNKAVAYGVFDGTMPRGEFTREQAATVFEKMGILTLSTQLKRSDWAAIAWDKAVEMGIIEDSNPRATLTREELTMVLSNMGLI